MDFQEEAHPTNPFHTRSYNIFLFAKDPEDLNEPNFGGSKMIHWAEQKPFGGVFQSPFPKNEPNRNCTLYNHQCSLQFPRPSTEPVLSKVLKSEENEPGHPGLVWDWENPLKTEQNSKGFGRNKTLLFKKGAEASRLEWRSKVGMILNSSQPIFSGISFPTSKTFARDLLGRSPTPSPLRPMTSPGRPRRGSASSANGGRRRRRRRRRSMWRRRRCPSRGVRMMTSNQMRLMQVDPSALNCFLKGDVVYWCLLDLEGWYSWTTDLVWMTTD